MSWDEKAEEAAQPFGDCRSHDMRFVNGAEWQRDQLRTDEAAERVARHNYERAMSSAPQLGPPCSWDEERDDYREGWRQQARAVITALLGTEL